MKLTFLISMMLFHLLLPIKALSNDFYKKVYKQVISSLRTHELKQIIHFSIVYILPTKDLNLDEEKHYYRGYYINNVTIAVKSGTIQMINHTPRKFSSVVFVSDGVAYQINTKLNPFSIISIKIHDHLHLSDGTKSFLDPNPAFTPAVQFFSKKASHTDPKTLMEYIQDYGLILSHMKEFYGQKSTKKKFIDFFINKRSESKDSMLSKWFRTNTYNTPKQYSVYKCSAAGCAGNQEVAINWPMDRFNKDKHYTYIYAVYSHEYAHTMGYGHSSGLAYGWDDYVDHGISELLKTEDPSLPVAESAQVYWYFDRSMHQLKAYSLENIKHIDNISIISLVDFSTYVKESNDSIQIKMPTHNTGTFLVSGEIAGSDRLFNHIMTLYPLGLKAFDSNEIEIHTFPISGPAFFKFIGEKVKRKRWFFIEYMKVGTGDWKWTMLKGSFCTVKYNQDPAHCYEKDWGWNKKATYQYRPVQSLVSHVHKRGNILTLAPEHSTSDTIQWDPTTVSSDQIQPHSVRITWKLPTAEQGPNNPMKITFTVIATLKTVGTHTSSTQVSSCEFVAKEKKGEGSCTLNDLETNKTYQVSVTPHATGYEDGNSATITVTISHIKIQWNHQDVSVSDVTQNSALIHWNPKVITPKDVKQVAFVVTARLMHSNNHKDMISGMCQSNYDMALLSETPSYKECTLHGLAIGEHYQVTVIPHIIGYIDGDAGIINFKTAEQPKPQPVTVGVDEGPHYSKLKIIGAGLVGLILIAVMLFG